MFLFHLFVFILFHFISVICSNQDCSKKLPLSPSCSLFDEQNTEFVLELPVVWVLLEAFSWCCFTGSSVPCFSNVLVASWDCIRFRIKFLARAFCKWWYVLPLGRRLSLLLVGKAEIIDDHCLVHEFIGGCRLVRCYHSLFIYLLEYFFKEKLLLAIYLLNLRCILYEKLPNFKISTNIK